MLPLPLLLWRNNNNSCIFFFFFFALKEEEEEEEETRKQSRARATFLILLPYATSLTHSLTHTIHWCSIHWLSSISWAFSLLPLSISPRCFSTPFSKSAATRWWHTHAPSSSSTSSSFYFKRVYVIVLTFHNTTASSCFSFIVSITLKDALAIYMAASSKKIPRHPLALSASWVLTIPPFLFRLLSCAYSRLRWLVCTCVCVCVLKAYNLQ